MTYGIEVTRVSDWLWECAVTITDGKEEVIKGKTKVVCESEQEARDYCENTFLPDLKNNYPRTLAPLEFPEELPEGVV